MYDATYGTCTTTYRFQLADVTDVDVVDLEVTLVSASELIELPQQRVVVGGHAGS